MGLGHTSSPCSGLLGYFMEIQRGKEFVQGVSEGNVGLRGTFSVPTPFSSVGVAVITHHLPSADRETEAQGRRRCWVGAWHRTQGPGTWCGLRASLLQPCFPGMATGKR